MVSYGLRVDGLLTVPYVVTRDDDETTVSYETTLLDDGWDRIVSRLGDDCCWHDEREPVSLVALMAACDGEPDALAHVRRVERSRER